MRANLSAAAMRRILNFWPPFLFAGIRVRTISDDFRRARVELRQHWYNSNYVGTHFGGSLFAMTDPFWMLLTMRSLGSAYIVWDRAAEIEFVAPGRGTVSATFDLDDATVDAIRAATDDGRKHLHWFDTEVRNDSGEIVARVRKQLYVRHKRGRAANA